jgi:hypothetical protein
VELVLWVVAVVLILLFGAWLLIPPRTDQAQSKASHRPSAVGIGRGGLAWWRWTLWLAGALAIVIAGVTWWGFGSIDTGGTTPSLLDPALMFGSLLLITAGIAMVRKAVRKRRWWWVLVGVILIFDGMFMLVWFAAVVGMQGSD